MADGKNRTGAAAHETGPQERELRKAEAFVRRLQARIVKAHFARHPDCDGTASRRGAFERPEPCTRKRVCTVLRARNETT